MSGKYADEFQDSNLFSFNPIAFSVCQSCYGFTGEYWLMNSKDLLLTLPGFETGLFDGFFHNDIMPQAVTAMTRKLGESSSLRLFLSFQ